MYHQVIDLDGRILNFENLIQLSKIAEKIDEKKHDFDVAFSDGYRESGVGVEEVKSYYNSGREIISFSSSEKFSLIHIDFNRYKNTINLRHDDKDKFNSFLKEIEDWKNTTKKQLGIYKIHKNSYLESIIYFLIFLWSFVLVPIIIYLISQNNNLSVYILTACVTALISAKFYALLLKSCPIIEFQFGQNKASSERKKTLYIINTFLIPIVLNIAVALITKYLFIA